MNKTLQKIIAPIALAGTLAGITGCVNNGLKKPDINDHKYNVSAACFDEWGYCIRDVDGDLIIDVISTLGEGNNKVPLYMDSKKLEEIRNWYNPTLRGIIKTSEITQELQNSASRLLQESNWLRYVMDRNQYEAEKQKRTNRESKTK